MEKTKDKNIEGYGKCRGIRQERTEEAQNESYNSEGGREKQKL